MERPAPLPDAVLRYADHADGVIDLFLPPKPADPSTSTPPLLLLVHGGFWRQAFDRTHSRPMAVALAARGYVVAVPEYRRVGGEGGWPTTAYDVRAAIDALPRLLGSLGLRTATATAVGHSAGGHLVLWLANESTALRLDRVVGLAPVADLRAAAVARLGNGAPQALLGGSPDEVPDAYDEADPAERFSQRPAARVVIVHGTEDDVVPLANSRCLAGAYDFVDLRPVEADHFAVIDPLSAAWPAVLDALG